MKAARQGAHRVCLRMPVLSEIRSVEGVELTRTSGERHTDEQ